MTESHRAEAAQSCDAFAFDFEAGRRAFLKAAGLGGALAAFAGAMSDEAAAAASPDVDVAILNFALNLEYLEGEYYNRAVFGLALTSDLTGGLGTQGAVSGGSQVPFKNAIVQDLGAEIANDEKAHIQFIRSALGKRAVAEPGISLDASFTAFAAAAGLPSTFSPYADDFSFLLGAYILTEVGVTAYIGAAPFITSKVYLSAASSILGAESYHIGAIRTLLFAQQNAFYNNATALISAARRNLSGANDDQGIGGDQSVLGGNFPTPSNIVPTDANSLAYARTPRQILNIVYGMQNASKGGFFPNGANGGPDFRQLLAATAG